MKNVSLQNIRGAKPMGVSVTFDKAIMRDVSFTDSELPFASFDGAARG